MIIEWNTHLFSSDTTRYPFFPDAFFIPHPSRHEADPLAAYIRRMEAEGIDRAVFVHPEPYGDDHRLILDCLARDSSRFKGTSLFFPKDPDAPAKLADLVAQQPAIISTRFHAHRGKRYPYLDSFADPGVRALWGKAVELGLIVELHIGPDYALQVREVLREIPETIVLIDHLAEPHTGNPVEFANILDLAEFDRVYMKLSGLGHFAKDAPHFESVKPFTRRVADAFGPNRLVWSGGTPEIVDIHLDHWSESERHQVKGGNLKDLVWPGES